MNTIRKLIINAPSGTRTPIAGMETLHATLTPKALSGEPGSNQRPIDIYYYYSQPLYQLSYRRFLHSSTGLTQSVKSFLKPFVGCLLAVYGSLYLNNYFSAHLIIIPQGADLTAPYYHEAPTSTVYSYIISLYSFTLYMLDYKILNKYI